MKSINYDPPHLSDSRILIYLLPLELLMIVFSHLRKHDLAMVARVCRFWSSAALDLLWESIVGLSALLKTGYSLQLSKRVSFHSIWRAMRYKQFLFLVLTNYILLLGLGVCRPPGR